MTSDIWYPDGIRDEAPRTVWGTYTDTGEPKFVIHTTESRQGVYVPDPNKGAGRRYYGNVGTWPNHTLAVDRRTGSNTKGKWRVFCHIPVNRSSLSLRNQPGGVQTNRDNVSQIEIAAQAVSITSLPAEALAELARLLAWENKVRKVPLTSTVTWVPYPKSYGVAAAQRLGPQAWDAYSGVLGHQHVPENSHGDPGDFPIQRLLRLSLDVQGKSRTPDEREPLPPAE